MVIFRNKDSNLEALSVLAVACFSLVQGVIAAFSVLLWTRVFHFSPSAGVTENPLKELIPSSLFALLVLLSVFLFRRFLRADMWRRSPFASSFNARYLLLALVLGFLPIVLHTLFGCLFLGATIVRRPSGELLLWAPIAAFIVVCLLNAFLEELAFRTTPLALLQGGTAFFAFLIPTFFFVLAHFLEPARALSTWRILELVSAALLFFLVANDYGLFPATLTHTALNLGYFLTDGSWHIGALMDVHWNQSHEAWLIGDCAAIWASTLVYLVLFLRSRRKKSRTRDFVLNLTPV